MEAAAKLPLNTDDRVGESDIDWNKCVVCQESKFPKTSFFFQKELVQAFPGFYIVPALERAFQMRLIVSGV